MVKFLKGVEHSIKKIIPNNMRKYVRNSRYELVTYKSRPIELIVHVGAHFAEDAEHYEGLGAKTVLWIEADPDTHAKLTEIVNARKGSCRHIAHLGLVSQNPGEVLEFHRFNGDGSSSSVYHATEQQKQRFERVKETGEVLKLPTQTLDQILSEHVIDVAQANTSMLVVDVQGHELSVMKGVGRGLAAFSFCKTEVSRVPMYVDAVLFPELDSYICGHGFQLASHPYWRVPKHGDVLYQRY